MELTYTFELTSLITKNANDLVGAIAEVYWTCTGKNLKGTEGAFTGTTIFDLENVDSEKFIEFNNLTKEQVLTWVEDALNSTNTYPTFADVTRIIERQITEKIEHTHTILPFNFPWQPGYTGNINGVGTNGTSGSY
jgi:hypothetical protein